MNRTTYDHLMLEFSSENEAWEIVLAACRVIQVTDRVPRAMLGDAILKETGISSLTFNAMIDSLLRCRVIAQDGEILVWIGNKVH